MTTSYYELSNVRALSDAEQLTIGRARKLAVAIDRHRDYSLVEALRYPREGDLESEFLVVDVECDGVPPKNDVGISYRERLVLQVPANPKKLPNVLALRKDFPILIHQNQGEIGTPASLCLYFEPPTAVNRTWTPQSFLRRIQWWLEQSARRDLHPADQPVEHLFFASDYELVLPWNFGEIRKDQNVSFEVTHDKDPHRAGLTCFLRSTAKRGRNNTTTAYVELSMPPVVHGFVERDPVTLGQLADLLTRRGVDLQAPLRGALQSRVGEQGVPISSDDIGTVVLLHIPLRRNESSEVERPTHRAFWIPAGALKLGFEIGALMVHEGRYYQDLMNVQPAVSWRDLPVIPMNVLAQNDSAAARWQSGIAEDGPIAALVGAGSLGSALVNLWTRSGWGRWTVIDNDHVKPHNLTRHTAYAQHIGQSKATVVAQLNYATMEGAVDVTPLVADATDFSQESVKQALQQVDLVVDASTTLEYPRAASFRDELPRHVSIFVTPSGKDAVLLVEDAHRQQRLRTLEAQYYRAVIQNSWGEQHLSGNASTFWSGAGCRDISVVMPYSSVLVHAATLAEQIQSASRREEAAIRIWRRNANDGGVQAIDIPVARERCISLGELDLFIDAGVEEELNSLRQQGFPNETGGVLLGYYDFNINAAVIVAALAAPQDSKASAMSFERGVSGLKDAAKEAAKRTAGVVGYIGEWHSHPPGSSSSPSLDDLLQLVHLSLHMADDGLPAIQLIVGENGVGLLQASVR